MTDQENNHSSIDQAYMTLSSRNRAALVGFAAVCFGLLIAIILSGKSSMLLSIAMCCLVLACPVLVCSAIVIDMELARGRRTVISIAVVAILTMVGLVTGGLGIAVALWHFSSLLAKIFVGAIIISGVLGAWACGTLEHH